MSDYRALIISSFTHCSELRTSHRSPNEFEFQLRLESIRTRSRTRRGRVFLTFAVSSGVGWSQTLRRDEQSSGSKTPSDKLALGSNFLRRDLSESSQRHKQLDQSSAALRANHNKSSFGSRSPFEQSRGKFRELFAR